MSRTQRTNTAPTELTAGHLALEDRPDDAVHDAATTVLIAVEDSESESLKIVRMAHRLFGDGARYLVINVGVGPYSNMGWAYVSPVMYPMTWYPAVSAERTVEMTDVATDSAEQQAADVAGAASLDQATPLGEIGDPATAILTAAHQHEADVIVIGSHDRTWFSKLFTGSVGDELLRDADLPVLVIR
jgi:nucleotide-binding universal stress UspA family protein